MQRQKELFWISHPLPHGGSMLKGKDKKNYFGSLTHSLMEARCSKTKAKTLKEEKISLIIRCPLHEELEDIYSQPLNPLQK